MPRPVECTGIAKAKSPVRRGSPPFPVRPQPPGPRLFPAPRCRARQPRPPPVRAAPRAGGETERESPGPGGARLCAGTGHPAGGSEERRPRVRILRAAVPVRTEPRAGRGIGVATPGTHCLFLKVGLTSVTSLLCRSAAGPSPIPKIFRKLDCSSLLKGRAFLGGTLCIAHDLLDRGEFAL